MIYFMVIEPIGNEPIFLAVTEAKDRAQNYARRLRAPPSALPAMR